MNSRKVLFITHEATRTGAPIVLLNLLKWLKSNTKIPFQVLIKKTEFFNQAFASINFGALKSEFEALASVIVFNVENPTWTPINKILCRLGFPATPQDFHLKRLKAKLSKEDIGLIYANTITNGEILEFLADLQCPVICHIHELGHFINNRISLQQLEQVKKYTHHYIAASGAVRRHLIEDQGIPEEKITVVYEAIPIHFQSSKVIQQQREEICQQLDIPTSAKIVCASGTTDWRKGPDLFIQLAQLLAKEDFEQSIYFLWIGGQKQGIEYSQLQHDVQNLGLEKQVLFLGEQPDSLKYFAACDVFTLMSREDPYPLVCLEAASLGKPIICFEKSGGEPEFVEDDCGFVVPYLDMQVMAAKVSTLINSPELRQQLGANARRKVGDRHQVEKAGAQIAEIIQNFLIESSN